jgi:hypothetical protein
MEKYQGHFYNWYDTQSLKPLFPLYVSSVDSGNLAGHLLTFKQGLLGLPDQFILGPRLFDGIDDTLHILLKRAGKVKPIQLVQFSNFLNATINEPPITLVGMRNCLEKLSAYSAEIEKSVTPENEEQYRIWAEKLSRQCQSALDELTFLVPWLFMPDFQGISDKYPDMNTLPTLRDIVNTKTGEFTVVFKRGISLAVERAKKRIDIIEGLVSKSEEFSNAEYGFLYDKEQQLISIGFNVDDRRRDPGYYNLLATEARLTSFVAIAQDKIPQESWFALGRLLTTINGEPLLLSWSGSMFEYLMPLLVMPDYENSLLFQTCKTAVSRQIEYGKQRSVPWGISESGYNSVDVQQNYQYRAFGVPGLGLRRGLSEDLVIAPYSTALALMVMPDDAYANLALLADKGFLGTYGFTRQ